MTRGSQKLLLITPFTFFQSFDRFSVYSFLSFIVHSLGASFTGWFQQLIHHQVCLGRFAWPFWRGQAMQWNQNVRGLNQQFISHFRHTTIMCYQGTSAPCGQWGAQTEALTFPMLPYLKTSKKQHVLSSSRDSGNFCLEVIRITSVYILLAIVKSVIALPDFNRLGKYNFLTRWESEIFDK